MADNQGKGAFKDGFFEPITELLHVADHYGEGFEKIVANPRHLIAEAKDNAKTLHLHAITVKAVVVKLRKEVKRLNGEVPPSTKGAIDWLTHIAEDFQQIAANAALAITRLRDDSPGVRHGK
jgi:hypothetical protein